jgi:predicted Zn-dependent protease
VPLPAGLTGVQLDELSRRRSVLLDARYRLASQIVVHNAKCRSVDPTETALVSQCTQSRSALDAQYAAYVSALREFEAAAARAVAFGTSGGESGVRMLLSVEQEMEVGRQQANDIESQSDLMWDAPVLAYLQGVMDRLIRHSTRPGVGYAVMVVERSRHRAFREPNVATTADGRIFMDVRILRSLRTEGELAGVLAHEMAHVEARHAAREIEKLARNMGIVTGLTTGPMFPLTSWLTERVMFRTFSRDQEREADRIAVELMYQAAIRPTGLIRIFEDHRRVHPFHRYWSTHPPDEERLQNLAPLLADPRFDGTRELDSPGFRLLRGRLVSP